MDEGLKQKLLSRMIEDAGPLDTPCWLWTGGMTGRDYGAVWWNSQQWKVHRASWLVHKGPIPEGIHVLHKCDVTRCFNPDHLFLETGDGRPRLVTVEQAAQMAILRQQGHSYASIGARFYVSGWTVMRALNRQGSCR